MHRLGRATQYLFIGAVTLLAAQRAAAQRVENFDEAYQLVLDTVEDVKAAQAELKAAESDDAKDPKLIDRAKATIAERGKEVLKAAQEAIPLADDAVEPKKRCGVEYLLAYFHLQQGDYYDAAVIGEYLARRHPTDDHARPSARVALSALDALYRQGAQAAGTDRAFEEERLLNLANYISKQWPDQPEAVAALDARIGIHLNRGEIEKATELINQLSPGTAGRADAEARLGYTQWTQYLRAAAQKPASASADPNAAPDAAPAEDPAVVRQRLALLAKAQATLVRALEASRASPPNERTLLAAVSLAQSYLVLDQPNRAVEVLEDPHFGPLLLMKQKHPGTQQEALAAEIHKTALQAFVQVEPPQIDKMTTSLEALEQHYANDPQAGARITQMLVGATYELQQHLQELGRRGDKAGQAEIAKTFETFLSKLGKHAIKADLKTMQWLAITYDTLGESLAAQNRQSPVAASYYRHAAEVYEQILSRAESQPDFVPADNIAAFRLRLALAHRGAGDYDRALDMLSKLLTERPQLLPVQVEAARTYQLRAENENASFYDRAILGDKDETQNIWGWGKLGIATAHDPRFRETFHEARYNLALCRRNLADTVKDAERKRKLLTSAEHDIRTTKSFDPTMGGEQWQPRYEELIRDIQKQLGAPVVGLEGL